MKTNKSYLLIAAVLTFLFTLPPTHTLAQETILDRLNKKLDIKLPIHYETMVKEFVDTCFWNVENTDNSTVRDIKKRMQNFTEQFVVEQMKEDWGIDRQNQLLFIWEAIVMTTTDCFFGDKNFDNKILKEFEKAIDNYETCEKKYEDGITPLIQEVIAEYKRVIAENKRDIEEGKRVIAENKRDIEEVTKEIMRLDSVGIKNMAELYEERSKLTQGILTC